MKRGVLVMLGLLLCLGVADLHRPTAEAFPAFKRQFDAKYLTQGTALYQAYRGRSTCNVCHVGGAMSREHRNDYGQALEKLLDRSTAEALSVESSRRNPQAAQAATKKIEAAFEAVEKLPADPREKLSPTFGMLLREGKLPISPMTLPDAQETR
jgi:hypothetical protein